MADRSRPRLSERARRNIATVLLAFVVLVVLAFTYRTAHDYLGKREIERVTAEFEAEQERTRPQRELREHAERQSLQERVSVDPSLIPDNRLVCVSNADTGRCSCTDIDSGVRVPREPVACQALAEGDR